MDEGESVEFLGQTLAQTAANGTEESPEGRKVRQGFAKIFTALLVHTTAVSASPPSAKKLCVPPKKDPAAVTMTACRHSMRGHH